MSLGYDCLQVQLSVFHFTLHFPINAVLSVFVLISLPQEAGEAKGKKARQPIQRQESDETFGSISMSRNTRFMCMKTLHMSWVMMQTMRRRGEVGPSVLRSVLSSSIMLLCSFFTQDTASWLPGASCSL
jgi:hypothetical protein